MATISSSTFMCSRTTTITPLHHSNFSVVPRRQSVNFCIIQQDSSKRLSCFKQLRGRDHTSILKPICAAGSGLQTSVADAEGSAITLEKVEYSVESQDADKLKLRVDLTGDETQKAYNTVLSKLARSAPPTPGFRRQKGGKTSKVPKNLLLNILGKGRVMGFVIRELVTSAVANYVEEEKLNVRDNTINTTQTEDELKQSFLPGNAFGFNVELELVNEENETASTDSEQ